MLMAIYAINHDDDDDDVPEEMGWERSRNASLAS